MSDREGAKARSADYALLLFVVLAFVNLFALLDIPATLIEARQKLVHYSFSGFDPAAFGRAWAGNAWHAALAIFLLAGCWGLGATCAGWAGGWRLLDENWLFSWGAGFGVTGLAALGLGLCGLFHPASAALLLGIGALVTVTRERIRFAFGWSVLKARVDQGSWETRWLLAALAVMGGICLLMALGPEVGWDPAYYHLRLPLLYALDHKVRFVPYIYPSHYPGTVEMLYGLGWLLGGEGVARLVNFSFWPLCGAALFQLALPCGQRTALRAVTLALTMPLVGTIASECYIDLGLTLFQLLAVHEAWRGRTVAAGLLLGFSCGSKYTGIFAAGALASAALAMRVPLRSVAGMAAACAIPVLPWLAKNAVFTGDPVAPFFYGALGRLEWAWGISQSAMGAVIPRLLPTTWEARGTALALGLWDFLKTHAFAVYSPFVLAMVAGLTGRLRGYEAYLRDYVVAFTFGVLLLAPDGRYWMPAAFPLAVLAAVMWRRMEGLGPDPFGRSIRALAWLGIVTGVAYHGVDMHRMFTSFWTAAGLESRRAFEVRVRYPTPWYAVSANIVNGTAPRGERVAVISDVQAYMINRDAIFDCDAPGSKRWIHLMAARRGTEEAIARQFRQWHVRTVLYLRGKAFASSRGEEWKAGETGPWARFWNARARLVTERGDCCVYELESRGKQGMKMDLPGPQDWLMNVLLNEDIPFASRKAVFFRAVKDGAGSAYSWAIYGDLARLAGDGPGAVDALRRSVAAATQAPGLWFLYARSLIAARRYREAATALGRGAKLDPASAEVAAIRRELAGKGRR
jgi:hypothetical protein